MLTVLNLQETFTRINNIFIPFHISACVGPHGNVDVVIELFCIDVQRVHISRQKEKALFCEVTINC